MNTFISNLTSKCLAALLAPFIFFCVFSTFELIDNVAISSGGSTADINIFSNVFVVFMITAPLFLSIGVPISLSIDYIITRFRWITYPISAALIPSVSFFIFGQEDLFTPWANILIYSVAGLIFFIALYIVEKCKLKSKIKSLASILVKEVE